jgi:hypothetical protein
MKLTQQQNKAVICGLAVIIAILSALALVDSGLRKTAVSRLDETGKRYFSQGIERSVYVYAMVRGINGVISVLQDTEISISPAGIGLNLAVGEILDPVNDLVERFSWVMLISIASFGIQKILMDIGTWFGFRFILSLSMVMIAAGVWVRKNEYVDLRSWGYRLALLSLIIRFGIPASAWMSEQVYTLFLEDQYNEAVQSLELVSRNIEAIEPSSAGPTRPSDDGGPLIDRLKRLFETTSDAANIREKLAELKDILADSADYITKLIVVFLFETVVLPIFMLWLLLRSMGHILRIRRLI